jgi:tryptophan-rich sensory protein
VSLAIIVLMAIAIAATIVVAWRTQRVAASLLIPYLAWVVYATSLNAGIVALNS